MKNLFQDPHSTVDLKDRLHVILKNFKEAFPDNFEQSGIVVCEKCCGTGLPIDPKTFSDTGLTFWQPKTYCSECRGIGFHGFDRVYEKYLCSCDGNLENYCKKCKNTGLVDWVTRVMNRL